ncbi:MAG: amylo-alpha-1,6-glucosidase [Candidatus Melainabacteria bacterium]|nr:MAG: amylo-alpha-1,6-glucosidase [Candidatus Melainabacteria bacterium]
MPFEISVGPPVLTINQGNTILVTDLDGSVRTDSEMGLYSFDTRLVSHYEVLSNGNYWTRLSSSTTAYDSARIHLINRSFNTECGRIPENTVALTIDRQVAEGVVEQLTITNYGPDRIKFNFEIVIRCDFADIFEVRANSFYRRGRIATEWRTDKQVLVNEYSNGDFQRRLDYKVLSSSSPAYLANGRVTFEVELDRGATWQAEAQFVTSSSEGSFIKSAVKRIRKPAIDLRQAWSTHSTKLTSSNEDIYRFYRCSVEDMGAMRLYEQLKDVDLWIPAAGVPWYVTLFGRDSLIVSLQTMPISARLGIGALHELAQYQAKAIDDWRDAEPGKIPHEIRAGELAYLKRIPHTPYYGTADATPLFLIVLHEAWKWLGNNDLLKQYKDVTEKCLDWIDNYGDIDGDGFQEYKTRSREGYENMGWKDSGDAIVYPDGSQVKQPKALCELQGYVYDAWVRTAEAFTALGELEKAQTLRKKAEDLKDKFAEHFWCDDIGFFALTLDSAKQPVKTIASNAGHCLWSGIAKPEHADRIVKRFFEPDLFSGWGIRTLSSLNPAFNPHSYHLGSIWPHDNGLIALGFKRYGYHAEAARVARDISEAASFFVGHRLPELYAGTERTPGSFPVQYLQANVPQAWAAGSIFHLLQAMLGLQADAPNHKLYVDPQLPKWLPDITLTNLSVGDAILELRFWRDGSESRWDAKVVSGKLEVEQHDFHLHN